MARRDPAPDAPTLTVVEAPRCRACSAMRPIVAEVAGRHPEVVVERVDASADPGRVRSLAVMGTPTLIGRRGGHEVFRVVGARDVAELDRLVAALVTGDPVTRSTSPGDAVVRLVAGAGLTALGLAASTPVLAVAGVALIAWAAAGWMRPR